MGHQVKKGSTEEKFTENMLKENVNYIKYEHPVYKDEDMKKFNDDHIRRMVFASSSHESSDNPESDAASEDENQKKVNVQQK